ncbi:hypothetical protein [Paenibacillus alvei]|uniref:Uncharacterized protein n=1 Tax=Paenibacillus alvei TaxID=44250 RepID=A0A383REE0_PAEAL|nr:hypothetical protein [Paenibacillus alvei]SYX84626.1 protein of unknown function [Paenibacillus alvei]
MKTTVTSKPYSIRDFENDMARVSELMKGITPDFAEAFRSLAHSLEVGLNIEEMEESRGDGN